MSLTNHACYGLTIITLHDNHKGRVWGPQGVPNWTPPKLHPRYDMASPKVLGVEEAPLSLLLQDFSSGRVRSLCSTCLLIKPNQTCLSTVNGFREKKKLKRQLSWRPPLISPRSCGSAQWSKTLQPSALATTIVRFCFSCPVFSF